MGDGMVVDGRPLQRVRVILPPGGEGGRHSGQLVQRGRTHRLLAGQAGDRDTAGEQRGRVFGQSGQALRTFRHRVELGPRDPFRLRQEVGGEADRNVTLPGREFLRGIIIGSSSQPHRPARGRPDRR